MTENQTRLLAALAQLADALQGERDRLVVERATMLAVRAGVAVACFPFCFLLDLDPGEFQTRADATLTLIERLESFVVDTLANAERAVAAGDLNRGIVTLEAAERVFGAVSTYSPIDESRSDVRQLLADIGRDLGKLPTVAFGGFGVGVALLLGYSLLKK